MTCVTIQTKQPPDRKVRPGSRTPFLVSATRRDDVKPHTGRVSLLSWYIHQS